MKIKEIVSNEEYDDNQYILFDDGSMLRSIHEEDYWEEVYADFRNMQVMMPQDKNFMWAQELDFYEDILNSIVRVPEVGFYIVTKQGICILVSCYNDNNGYYSDNLALEHRGARLDITGCAVFLEDNWYPCNDLDKPDVPELAKVLGKEGFEATGKFEGVYRRELQKIDLEIEAMGRLFDYIHDEYVPKMNEYSRAARRKALTCDSYFIPPVTKIHYILNTFPEACEKLVWEATSDLCVKANLLVSDWQKERMKKLKEKREAMEKVVKG